jgi:hypothetical protein
MQKSRFQSGLSKGITRAARVIPPSSQASRIMILAGRSTSGAQNADTPAASSQPRMIAIG